MSTLKVNTLEEATAGGATFYTSKAWVNFNGQGTVSIRADGNVSSLTDNGAGRYQVNFSSNFSDANYSVMSNMQAISGNGGAQAGCLVEYNYYSSLSTSMQTSSVRVNTIANTFTPSDSEYVGVNITR